MDGAWTIDRALALAPDASSASAGQSLGSASKWKSLARSDRAIWGLCQGSGKDPYQVGVDLSEPAFKCSCPSRKFPCKHGIGLMLLLAKSASAFKADREPGWVSEWIEGRAERAEKKVDRAASPEKPADPEARAARQAKREGRVKDGVAQCRVWLEDLVRRGLASAQSAPQSFWDQPAARMVDAQAPGLAVAIRKIAQAVSSGGGWHERTLDLVGRLHLVLAAADRLESLPPDLAGDTRDALGWTHGKEEVLAQAGVSDRWMVVGQVQEEEDRLRVRRTWLLGGNTGRRGLVLDFAAGAQPMDASLVAGTEFDGEVVFYPSRLPLRAMVKSRAGGVAPIGGSLGARGDASCEDALGKFAQSLAQLPWLSRWPMLLSAVVPTLHEGACLVADARGECLPISPGFQGRWRLMSLGGGRAVDLIGEWDGEFLLPLAVLMPGVPLVFEDVAPRWIA